MRWNTCFARSIPTRVVFVIRSAPLFKNPVILALEAARNEAGRSIPLGPYLKISLDLLKAWTWNVSQIDDPILLAVDRVEQFKVGGNHQVSRTAVCGRHAKKQVLPTIAVHVTG